MLRNHALGRLKAGTMNKTEAAYAMRLEAAKQRGEVIWYEFEPVKLRLAAATFYSPDFMVLNAAGEIEMHEVKGFWQDDARVKIKVAAAKYPFIFKAIQYKRKEWIIEEF